jgi:hypothetical protein
MRVGPTRAAPLVVVPTVRYLPHNPPCVTEVAEAVTHWNSVPIDLTIPEHPWLLVRIRDQSQVPMLLEVVIEKPQIGKEKRRGAARIPPSPLLP